MSGENPILDFRTYPVGGFMVRKGNPESSVIISIVKCNLTQVILMLALVHCNSLTETVLCTIIYIN